MNFTNQLNTIEKGHTSIDDTNSSWLDIRSIKNNKSLSREYADICQQHHLNNKWILMINPENDSLEQLSQQSEVDTSKILKVTTNTSKTVLKNIASALSKGNCSAVILSNPSLAHDEMSQLNRCAKLGKTACIVLENSNQLH